jgi:hypothetical protein
LGYAAQALGYPVNATPAKGAVAWWPSGHVAWVEAVSGSNILIEEYNWNYTHSFHERWIPSTNVKYIHLRISRTAPTATEPSSGPLTAGSGGLPVGRRCTSTPGTPSAAHCPSWLSTSGRSTTAPSATYASTPPAALGRQQRPQPLPLRVREVSSSHGAPLPHQHAIREIGPSSGPRRRGRGCGG